MGLTIFHKIFPTSNIMSKKHETIRRRKILGVPTRSFFPTTARGLEVSSLKQFSEPFSDEKTLIENQALV